MQHSFGSLAFRLAGVTSVFFNQRPFASTSSDIGNRWDQRRAATRLVAFQRDRHAVD